MMIEFDFSALKKTKWYEYSIRFLAGGAITVAAGLIAERFGPALGGLFLAFPAIFPASATLVEKHEKEKKLQAGVTKTMRGRYSAALDARGAAMGSLGLVCFALTIWKFLPAWAAGLTLFAAVGEWLAVAIVVWRFRHIRRLFSRRKRTPSPEGLRSSK
jgi:hypothetical protein